MTPLSMTETEVKGGKGQQMGESSNNNMLVAELHYIFVSTQLINAIIEHGNQAKQKN